VSGLALLGACKGGTLSTPGGPIRPSGRAGATGAGNGGAAGTIGIVTGAGGGANCGTKTLSAKAARLDVLLLLDASASMDENLTNVPCDGGCGDGSKWAEATAAINAVVGQTQAAVNWGVKIFPDPAISDVCTVANTVSVPVAPGNAGAVAAVIAGRTSANGGVLSAGNTATRAAETAAMNYLSTLADGNRKMIVLVTDGAPNCAPGSEPSTEDSAGTVDAIKRAWIEGVSTFVVGMVASYTDDPVLNDMAIVGGERRPTMPAYYPVAESAALVDVLTAMLQNRAPCIFALPEPPNDSTSNLSDIAITLDGTQLPHDPARFNGWDYTDNSLSHVQLFGPACDAAMPGSAHDVSVQFLCLIP